MAKKKEKELVDKESGEVFQDIEDIGEDVDLNNVVETAVAKGEQAPQDEAEARKAKLKSKFQNIKDYRAKANIKPVEYKPQEWINMSDAFKKSSCLPGIPVGHLVMCMGKSDVGKTTLLVEAGAHALQQGFLPILIITESKFSWERAETMGLYEEYSIVHNVKTIEEGWERISQHLDDLESGVLQKTMGVNDVIFLWDSIGATPSKAELENSKTNLEILRKVREAEVSGNKVPKDDLKHGGMMVTAKVLREKFTRDLAHRINNTRDKTCPYNASLVIVNHAYTAPPKPPATISTLEPYGGDAIWLASSLVFRMGGVASRSSSVTATKNGMDVSFAIKSAFVVEKNHITNVKAKAKIICTDHGFIEDNPTVINDYKAKYRNDWDLNFDKYWDNVSDM